VERARLHEKPISHIAEELGIADATLHRLAGPDPCRMSP
jgi:hypothetical protein